MKFWLATSECPNKTNKESSGFGGQLHVEHRISKTIKFRGEIKGLPDRQMAALACKRCYYRDLSRSVQDIL